MALTTLNDVKGYLGISLTDTQYDAKLEIMRKSVEQSVLNYCEVDFASHVVTKELIDGTQSDVLVTKYFPVLSVQAIYFDCDSAGEGGSLLDSDLYSIDQSAIYLRGVKSPYTSRGTVRVDYTHGYTAVPDDVLLCVYQSVKAEFNRDSNNTEHLSNRSKEDESEGYLSAWDKKTGLPSQIISKLQAYRVYEFPMVGMAQRNM